MKLVMSSGRNREVVFLGVLILKDLLKQFFFFILLIAAVVLSFAMIEQEQETRTYVIEINKENKRQSKLEEQYQHLKLEQEVLLTHSRVENVAQEKLHMVTTDIHSEKVINLTKK